MSDHDPMCAVSVDDRYSLMCQCDFIAKVRADERERIAQAIEAEAIEVWEGKWYAHIARNPAVDPPWLDRGGSEVVDQVGAHDDDRQDQGDDDEHGLDVHDDHGTPQR